MGLSVSQSGIPFVLPVSGRKMRRKHCKTYEKSPLLFLFIVIKYNHNKERGGLVWLMQ